MVPPVRSMVRRVLPVERRRRSGPAGRVVEVDVGEPLEALADADHLEAVLPAPVDHALDDRVEARDVAAAGEDADAPRFFMAQV